MRTMDALSIRYNSSLCADRAHARAGDSHASTGIDFACTTTQRVIAIASPHELHGDSWPSSPTGTSSFCCNHQYSITAVTTSTGNIAERYAYTAYGLPTILDPSGVTLPTSNFSIHTSYTGREWDATLGLHHFRARWMSPNAGRFLGRDPIGFEGSEWGLYEFVDSKPLIDADPFGEFSIAMLGLRQRRTRNAIEVCRRCYMQNGYCVADVSGSTWLESQFRRLLPLPAQTGRWNEIPGSRRFFSRKDWNADCCSSCAELGDVVNSCETFYSEPTKWKNWYPPPPPPRNSGPWA